MGDFTSESSTNQKKVGFRFWAMLIGVIAAFLLTFVTDPDSQLLFKIPVGVSVFLLIKSMAYFALAALIIHIGGKTMFDYIDRSKLIDRAVADGQSGHVFVGLAIYAYAFVECFNGLSNLRL